MEPAPEVMYEVYPFVLGTQTSMRCDQESGMPICQAWHVQGGDRLTPRTRHGAGMNIDGAPASKLLCFKTIGTEACKDIQTTAEGRKSQLWPCSLVAHFAICCCLTLRTLRNLLCPEAPRPENAKRGIPWACIARWSVGFLQQPNEDETWIWRLQYRPGATGNWQTCRVAHQRCRHRHMRSSNAMQYSWQQQQHARDIIVHLGSASLVHANCIKLKLARTEGQVFDTGKAKHDAECAVHVLSYAVAYGTAQKDGISCSPSSVLLLLCVGDAAGFADK